MKKQIATATVIGALLASACLLCEQQSVAAVGNKGQATGPLRPTPSPFDWNLRYRNV